MHQPVDLQFAEAARFLKALDPKATFFTFQIFSDDKSKKLARIIHGTLEECFDALGRFNASGAGIFVTINATNGKGRKAKHIVRVRALFVDLDDGASLDLKDKRVPKPHIVVESSPGRWHCYWIVIDVPLDDFKGYQKALARHFKSDPSVDDLPRVMRLPGFIHRKAEPFRSRIVSINKKPPYKVAAFAFLNVQNKPNKPRIKNTAPVEIKDVVAALAIIPSDAYKIWFEVGCALYKELGDDAGYPVFDRWSRKSEKYNKDQCESKWEECGKISKYTAATIFHFANEAEDKEPPSDSFTAWVDEAYPGWNNKTTTREDFCAYMQTNDYIYLPTRDLWPASRVDARLGSILEAGKKVKASVWLARYRPVEQMTWAPGLPLLIKNQLMDDGGWIPHAGVTIFNRYRPPTLKPRLGDATPWLNHVSKLYPDEAEHILKWAAHRVQRPHEKINHALILGGKQGIGKDTIFEPVIKAVGPWNCAEISPKQVLGEFTGFLRTVILRINEARDLGDADRYKFYDHMKSYTVAPPDVLRVNEKHMREYYILNLLGAVITTNYKTSGMYLPADDRRYYVAWSNLTSANFAADYFRTLYTWYADGGNEIVADYLLKRDISDFDPTQPPPKTAAFWEIVNANRPTEDSELADVLDKLQRPDIVTLDQVVEAAEGIHPGFAGWLCDRKNRRSIPHRFEECGYVVVTNANDSEGRWKIADKRYTIYGQGDLTLNARLNAVTELIEELRAKKRSRPKR